MGNMFVFGNIRRNISTHFLSLIDAMCYMPRAVNGSQQSNSEAMGSPTEEGNKFSQTKIEPQLLL